MNIDQMIDFAKLQLENLKMKLSVIDSELEKARLLYEKKEKLGEEIEHYSIIINRFNMIKDVAVEDKTPKIENAWGELDEDYERSK